MSESREQRYAEELSSLIAIETVSSKEQKDISKFRVFHSRLRELFPALFSVCEYKEFDGSFFLRWQGENKSEPIMLMNHHDVVEATGEWKYPPFSGTVADGKIWGRGTLDTKGGLWAMLRAADELAESGFKPMRDVYFTSTCNEECTGAGAIAIAGYLKERGVHFAAILDEGGMIVKEPIAGAKGEFAMIGVGEKGCADLKFIARSSGGHASTPEKNTPLVRLGKFMAAADNASIFEAKISPTVAEMFSGIAESMSGPLKFILGNSQKFAPVLAKILPSVSPAAGAMVQTTLAFTMAGGSDGTNVLPREAWVIGNMRYSHHQGRKASIKAITELAKKYGVETEVLDKGVTSPVTDYRGKAFALARKTVNKH
ncbi:MAG: M20/M25/M40 family metallo-hydrolase, partial [Clostridia bacterium]|nr:M20/M25/M40 family metallo-hydrolase [Clostridia bacterium]